MLALFSLVKFIKGFKAIMEHFNPAHLKGLLHFAKVHLVSVSLLLLSSSNLLFNLKSLFFLIEFLLLVLKRRTSVTLRVVVNAFAIIARI
jgi:hypothetical protein